MKKILLSVALLCSFGTVALLQADSCSSSKKCCMKKDNKCCDKKKKSCCDKKKKMVKKEPVKTMSELIEDEKHTAMISDNVENDVLNKAQSE